MHQSTKVHLQLDHSPPTTALCISEDHQHFLWAWDKKSCSTGAQISLTSTCHLCSFPYHLSLSPLPPSPKTHTRPLTNPVQEHDVQNVNCK